MKLRCNDTFSEVYKYCILFSEIARIAVCLRTTGMHWNMLKKGTL